MKLYDHAYSFGLEVISGDASADDVTGSDLRRALQARLDALSDDDLVAACDEGSPFDSHEVHDSLVAEILNPNGQTGAVGPHQTKVLSDSVRGRIPGVDVTPYTYRCGTCHSTDVLHDAWAEWNEAKQDFELGETYDATHCRQCDGDCKVEITLLEDCGPAPAAAQGGQTA